MQSRGRGFLLTEMEDAITPWICTRLSKNLNNCLLRYFRGERNGFVQVGPKKYLLPQKFEREGNQYYTFKPKATDTWVVSFPRSGTTWTQEMVWLLSNKVDFSRSAEMPLVERFPFLEFSSCVNDDILSEFLTSAENENVKKDVQRACGSVLKDLENMTEPRFIKSHLPFSLLNPELLTCGAKVVYVARNPKDVSVSYYHFHQFIKTLDYAGDFENFWNFFENNLTLWSPYWDHINEAWQLKDNPNLLFLFYEDLKKDLGGSLKKISKFLGKEYDEEKLQDLAEHLDFKNFKNNRSVNMEVLQDLGMLSSYDQRCIRQGKTGGWREVFTTTLNDQADRWIKKNLDKTNLILPESFKLAAEL